ncbi:MAG: PDZ domain-containing protein [Chloroflexi bacterium]|nr:PDZ domain-containing protein [Chloroflexota bacterium]
MKHIRILSFVVLGLAACARFSGQPDVPDLPTTDPVERQLRVLDTLSAALDEQFIYEDLGSSGWKSAHADYLAQVKGGLTEVEFEAALGDLAAKLPGEGGVYQSRSERIQADLQNTSLYSGIGAYVSVRAGPEPHIVILSIIEGSPAGLAGLKAHDSIFSIDGKPVTAEEGMDVVQRVRGEADTTVKLEVGSPGEPRRAVQVTRATLAAADTLKGGVLTRSGILYLLMPVASDDTLMDTMSQALENISQQNQLTGVIIDLRVAHTSGGWPLSEMLALYADGRLGEFYSRTKSTPVQIKGVDVGGSQGLPIVLIIGPDTEGSPEIFAAALQASKRATVIGLQTPGKIFGYTTVPLPNGSYFTFASQSYKTSKGQDLAEFGVKPDVEIKADWDEVDLENDPAIDKAIELLVKGQ